MNVGETRTIHGLEAQRALGAELAERLPPHGVLFLEGELGSGKTTLTQGLVAALGFGGDVSSPTYALMQLYPTARGEVLHVDAYRVERADELYRMDLEDLIERSVCSVIEWGQLFYDDLPQAWHLRLEHAEDGARRVTRLR